LAESLRTAHDSGALRKEDLARVTVDTTVQPKNVTFPTDAKLLHAAIKGLNRLARKYGVRLRQSYLRVAKRAAMMAGRYAHAILFDGKGGGECAFGCITGAISAAGDGNAIEFTWDGNDEMDEACGDGWAELQSDRSLKGQICFHGGDEASFTARMWKTSSTAC
jgi:hypothetical protein